MDMVRNNKGPDRMISNFETTVSYLLNYDLVDKRKSAGDERNYADASDMLSQLEVTSFLDAPKLSIGKTVVHFR